MLSGSHYLCDYEVGGEAGSGTWLCPDGNAYLLPGAAAGGAGMAVVLVVYVLWELRAPDGLDARQLSVLAAALGALPLALTGLVVAGMGAPIWLVAGYLVAAVIGFEVRTSPPAVFFPVLAIGAVVCTVAGATILLTAPTMAATAFTWFGAVLLRTFADRRRPPMTR